MAYGIRLMAYSNAMRYLRYGAGGLVGGENIAFLDKTYARTAAAEINMGAGSAFALFFHVGQTPFFKPAGLLPQAGKPFARKITEFYRQLQAGIEFPAGTNGADIPAGAAGESRG